MFQIGESYGIPQSPPYALAPGGGRTYRFGIDFTVKASEIAPASGVAVLEYTTPKGEEPPKP